MIAGGLFVLPGALLMLALAMLYGLAANLEWFAALFLGIKAAVLVIVLQALLRIAGRALKRPVQKALAVIAFAALFLFDAPFPAVVLGALAIGALVGSRRPQWLGIEYRVAGGEPSRGAWAQSLRAVTIWGAIWVLPLGAVLVFLGRDHVLWDVGVFFSQLAVVTFGGAYAVLAYMAQEAVGSFGWLRPGEMADGLGLAETTPGPLILVTQFVGYLAAFRAPEPFDPVVAGVLGAVLTTWVTFAPCFLWIFALAPWMERLQRTPALRGGLAAVTAAVVGVIANLAVWFALHVLFARVDRVEAGALRLQIPELASFDWRVLAVTAISALGLLRLKLGIPATLALSAAAGLALSIAS